MSAQAETCTDVVGLVTAWQGDAALFARDMFGAEPTAQQAAMLRAASAPGARVAVKSGHGVGKSAALSWLAIWGLVCHGDVCKIPCTAPTAHQLSDILWAECRRWRDRMLEPWRSALDISGSEMRIRGLPGFAAARTGRRDSPEALQGFHGECLIFLIDEASGIDDCVFEVARGALSTPGARVVMASNPTRTNGFFHRAFHGSRERWDVLTFSCEDSPLVAGSYAEEMADEYGRDSDIYRVRVLGEFPGGGDLQLIRLDDAERCLSRFYAEEVYGAAPAVLGVDVAAEGGDGNVIFLRKGLYARPLWAEKTCPTTAVSGKAAQLAAAHNARAIFVDACGVGFGVVSELRALGLSPVAVQFGGAAIDARRYKNKRAECWGLMRDWVTDGGGWIEAGRYAERLRDDLTAPDYGFDMTGRMTLERKEDMRKRGLASPDYADALALTFAAPVAPVDARLTLESGVGDYDPYQWAD